MHESSLTSPLFHCDAKIASSTYHPTVQLVGLRQILPLWLKNPLLVDHPLEMFFEQQLSLGEKEKDPLRSSWDKQSLVEEHYHIEIEHYTEDREDGSREDIAQAAREHTACDSREEQDPKERIRSLRDLQILAEHHHS